MRQTKVFIISLALLFCSAFMLPASTGQCAAKPAKINVKKLNLTKNEEYTLRIYNMRPGQTVSFTSDNEEIVSVKQKNPRIKSAAITAQNTGTAVVRADIYNRKGRLIRSLKTTVKVTPYGISIKFTQKKVNLKVSDIRKLSFIIKPNTSQELPLFESSNTDIVMINSKGVVTALASGEAYITATLLSSGQRVRCRIIVDKSDDILQKKQDVSFSQK